VKLAIIALLFLIPFSAFAQESQTEIIEEDSPVKYIVGIGIIIVIILAILSGRYRKKFMAQSIANIGWTESEKEQVRTRQDGKCAKCKDPPPAKWEYYHLDGNNTNNSLENCEGLCPNCYSVKTND